MVSGFSHGRIEDAFLDHRQAYRSGYRNDGIAKNITHRHRKAQLYITIDEMDYWGTGIADEAVGMLLEYGFVELNLNLIYLYTLPNNARARRVYERNGLTEDGILRQHYYCVGQFQDVHHHSILRGEWLAMTRSASGEQFE